MLSATRNLQLLLVLEGLLLGAALGACGDDGDDTHDVEAEICEHMQDGPIETVTATTSSTAASLPDAAFAHKRVDITLPADGPGYVAFDVAEAGDVLFALDRPVGFQVYAAPGERLEPESSETGAEACGEIARQYVYDLEVRSYILELTEVDPEIGTVGLVAESLGAHQEGEHAE